MKFNNLKLLQSGNYAINESNLGLDLVMEDILEYITPDRSTIFDTTAITYDDGTVSFINMVTTALISINTDMSQFNGNNVSAQDVMKKNSHFKSDITNFITPNHHKRFFEPNQNNVGTIILTSQEFDITFLLNRFKLYSKMEALENVFVHDYISSIVNGVVVKIGYTFLSNLKLMSKDTHFDTQFKDNPDKQFDYLLDSVKLVSDTTTYDGTTFDLDELNLSKLNIGIVNTQDWYVSYNVRDTITDEEIEYIKNKCTLEYKFVNRYNSLQSIVSNKKLLIGR